MQNPERMQAIAQHREFYSRFHSREELRDSGIPFDYHYGSRIERLGELLMGEAFQRDWRNFRGKRILDLGCGWDREPPSLEKAYAPYFCRLLACQQADVVGIDRAGAIDHDFLLYTHIIGDIVPWVMDGNLHEFEGLGRVKTIRGILFDIINCDNVISTFSPDVGMENRLNRLGIKIPTIRKSLIAQSPNMLRDEGILALDEEYYRNKHGRMVKI